ncbi:MAG: tetratricopeptide repeat protein [Pseudomonadota bacterium]
MLKSADTRRRIRCLLVLSSLVVLLIGCSSSEDRQARYFQRAQALMEEGNYDKAKLEVRNVLQINESHVQARYLWALLQEREQNYRQMFANLQLAVDLDPTYVDARIKFGQLLYRAQLYDESADEALAVLQLEPENVDALTLQGSVYFRQDLKDKAVDAARHALSLAPGHIGATSIITEVYKLNEPQLALAVIDEGLQLNSGDATLRLMAINVFDAQGDDDRVIEAYRLLMRDYPENLFYHYRLVKFLEEHNRIGEAEVVLRDIIRTKPENTELKLWLAEFLANQRDLQLAKSTVREFIVREPGIYELRFALGKIYELLHENDAANRVYDEIIALDGEGADALAARNRKLAMLMSKLEVDQATALIDEIRAIEADNALALLASARLNVGRADYEQAVSQLRTVTKNEPDNALAWERLAQANSLRGATELAVDNYKTALALRPDFLEAVLPLHNLYLDRGDSSMAMELLEAAIRAKPDVLVLRRMKARLALAEGDIATVEGTRDWFAEQEIIEEAEFLSGEIHVAQGDLAQAEEAFLRGVERAGFTGPYINRLVAHFRDHERAEAGLTALQELLQREPENSYLMNGIATFQYVQRNYDAAISQLHASLKERALTETFDLYAQIMSEGDQVIAALGVAEQLQPFLGDDPGFLLRLAQLEDQSGQRLKSEETYERVMMIQPESTVAANNLAMLLLRTGADAADKRRALALSSRFSSSTTPALLDTYGRALLANSRAGEALSVFNQAISAGGEALVDQDLVEVARREAAELAGS